jgi:hypothetical protein
MFAKLKNTDKWDEYMFEKTTNTVICTVKFNNVNNNIVVTTGRLNDNKWVIDAGKLSKDFEVTAWMPFPNPYVRDWM